MRLGGLWSRIFQKKTSRGQRPKRGRVPRRLAPELEALEHRTLLSGTPVLQPDPTQTILSAAANNSAAANTANNVAMAADPLNPQRLVAVFADTNDFGTTAAAGVIRARISNDGGLSWNIIPSVIGSRTDPATGTTQAFFPRASKPSVAWDTQGNFYVVATQSSADYRTSGALVMSKYFWAPGASSPTQQFTNVLQRWLVNEPIYNPTIAIDTNLGTTAQSSMTNKGIFIAWNTDTAGTQAASFGQAAEFDFFRGPQGIRLMISTDGGRNFTTPVWVTDGGPRRSVPNDPFGIPPRAISAPQILFTRGTVTPPPGSTAQQVPSGQMVVAWSDAARGQIFVDVSQPDGGQVGTRVGNAITGEFTSFFGVPLLSGASDTPSFNSFPINISNVPSSFTGVTNVNVWVNLQHNAANEVSLVLVSPTGTPVTLLQRRGTNTGIGVPGGGPGLGYMSNGGNSGLNISRAEEGLSLVFDQLSGIRISNSTQSNASGGGFIGRFRPESGGYDSGGLNVFQGLSASEITGTWTLVVINHVAQESPANLLLHGWGINISSTVPNELGEDNVPSNGGFPLPISLPPGTPDYTFASGTQFYPNAGIVPTLRLAQDTTTGPNSPYAGRIYMTYTSASYPFAPPGSNPPPDGYSIGLIASDDGGLTWHFPLAPGASIIDSGPADNVNSGGNRPSFHPNITTDPLTGTVLIAWTDLRNDPNQTRQVTYLSASNDGGATWSKNVFLNTPKTAFDTITRQDVVLEPIPGNPAFTAGGVGFGWQMGLAAIGGRVVTVWAGNDNNNGANVYANVTRYTAGPRVIYGDMGPVVSVFTSPDRATPYDSIGGYTPVTYNGSFAANGTRQLDSFVVQFDRPVLVSSFTPNEVTLLYRAPNSPLSVPGVNIPIASVVPLDSPATAAQGFGPRQVGAGGQMATIFRVVLQTPQSAVGTYSYSIGPGVLDGIQPSILPVVPDTVIDPPFNAPIPSAETLPLTLPDAVSSTTPTTTTTGITVTAGAGKVVAGLQVSINLTQFIPLPPNPTPRPYLPDLLIELVAPDGTSIPLMNRRTRTGRDITATFTDSATTSLAMVNGNVTGNVLPEVPLATFNGKPLTGIWQLRITDFATGATGLLNDWSIQFTPGSLADNADGNQMDQNSNGTTGQAVADQFAMPRPINGVPFQLPYATETLPLIIPGPYVVSITAPGATSVNGETVIVGSSGVSYLDVTFDRNMNAATFTAADVLRLITPTGNVLTSGFSVQALSPRTFRVSFPMQTANGVYALTLGPDIASVAGDRLDSNKNAGLANLRGGDPVSGTLNTLTFSAALPTADTVVNPPLNAPIVNSTPVNIPDAVGLTAGSATSSLTVTALGKVVAGLTVNVNLARTTSGATDYIPQLLVELIAPDGTVVRLMNQNGPGANRLSVTFSDAANQRIVDAVAVGGAITGTFTPETPLSRMNGRLISGTWRLRVTDLETGEAGRLNSWSLQFTPATQGSNGLSIPAGQTRTAYLPITDAFTVQQIAVNLSLLAQRTSDIKAVLIAPDGTAVTLFDGVGPAGFPNFLNTTLRDSATTPIQLGRGPFSQGPYNPQEPLNILLNSQSNGNWRLVITNRGASAATLTGFRLDLGRATAATGLGEPVADQFHALFRISNLDPSGPAATTQWTPIGPTANNASLNTSSVTSTVLDPSDPTGNTAYVTTSYGGIWKTLNLLTTDATGPKWIPILDFGPGLSMSISNLLVLPRNNNPNQSILIAGTGDGNSQSAFTGGAIGGVGMLRSEDGGVTWTVINGLVNYDNSGRPLPIDSPQRDGVFAQNGGMRNFRIVADPRPLSNGQYVIYAAFTGPVSNPGAGGIYRSLDSGRTWQLLRAGAANDVALPTGGPRGGQGLLTVYASFAPSSAGSGGLFRSDLSGVPGSWVQLTGNQPRLNPILDTDLVNNPPIPTNAANAPPADAARVTLGTIPATGDPLKDAQYSGWLYALVSTPLTAGGAGFGGLYVTKDYGRNWTRIRLAAVTDQPPNIPITRQPTNDTRSLNLDVQLHGILDVLANQALSLAVDPNNPAVVYIAGTRVVRVDTSAMMDAWALVNFKFNNPDGGAARNGTRGSVDYRNPPGSGAFDAGPGGLWEVDPVTGNLTNRRPASRAYLNLTRDPDNPFFSNSTLYAYSIATFLNPGTGAIWNYFETTRDGVFLRQGAVYGVQTFVDPITGKTRVFIGSEGGLFSVVDDGTGQQITAVNNLTVPQGGLNGNLQTLRMLGAAAQPSQVKADIVGALFYAATTPRGVTRPQVDKGLIQSAPDVLSSNNLNWTSLSSASAIQVLTDPTGSGVIWQVSNNYPVGGVGSNPDFLRVYFPDGSLAVRTTGLNAAATIWSNPTLAINPYSPQSLLVASDDGLLFRTVNNGLLWNQLTTPATGGPGAGAPLTALAFGAPDPTGTSADNYLLVGNTITVGGQTFGQTYYSLDGGATWSQIPVATGLFLGGVRRIVPSPVRGSYEAYAVSERGVWYTSDVRNAAWQLISGDATNPYGRLSSNTVPLFGDQNQRVPAIPTGGILTSLVVDWRSRRVIPGLPQSVPTLYVGADGGVFRSLNGGQTWTLFPSLSDGAPRDGGLMPRVRVTDLQLVQGNFDLAADRIDPETAMSLLYATTDGRGAFVIRLAPSVGVQGPRVVSVLPTTPNDPNGMSSVDVTFDRNVDPASFTASDVTFTRADGTLIPILGIERIGAPGVYTTYRLTFAPQTADGTYKMVLGVGITDFSGNGLNTIQDGANGDPLTDTFTARFFRHSTAAGPFPPVVITSQLGTITANYSNGLSRFELVPFDTLPRTATWLNGSAQDVTGDGVADFIGRYQQTGEWWVSVFRPGATDANGEPLPPGWTTSRWGAWDPRVNWTNVVYGDFGGTGRTSVAGRNPVTGEWQVALSTGTGFVSTIWARPLTAAGLPLGVTNLVVGDFNGDGRDDIAIQTAISSTLGNWTVLISTGQSFLVQQWGISPLGRTALQAGSLELGSGRDSIIGLNPRTGQVFTLISTGSSFQTEALWGVFPPGRWVDMRVGDLNGDGLSDVIARNANNGSWTAGFANGINGFNFFAFGGNWPLGSYGNVMLGDFTGDGRLDVAGRNLTNGRWFVSAWSSNQAAPFQFGPAQVWTTWSTAIRFDSIGVGDFNGDGRSDVIGRNPANGQTLLSLATTNATTGLNSFRNVNAATTLPTAVTWNNQLTGDFNGDGKTDVLAMVVANRALYVSESNGQRGLRSYEWGQWPAGTWSSFLVGDFNGDGRDDIAALNLTTQQWFVGISSGRSVTDPAPQFVISPWGRVDAVATIPATPRRWVDLRTADFNGDGRADLLARDALTNQWWVSLSTGTSFAASRWATWLPGSYVDTRVVDFNLDGLFDIVSRNSATGQWFVSFSDGSTFESVMSPSQVLWTTWAAGTYTSVQIADVNGDGLMDLVGQRVNGGAIQTSLTQFDPLAISGVSSTPPTQWRAASISPLLTASLLADLNGDGRADLIDRVMSTGRLRASLSTGMAFGASQPWDLFTSFLANVAFDLLAVSNKN